MIFGLNFSSPLCWMRNDFSLISDWKWYHFVGKVGIFVSSIITFVGDELLRLDHTKREYLDGYRLRWELRGREIGQIDLHSILRVSPAWSDNTHMLLHFTVNYQVLYQKKLVWEDPTISVFWCYSRSLTRVLSAQTNPGTGPAYVHW